MSKPCPTCKGAKIQVCTLVDHTVGGSPKESKFEIPCVRCDGTGEDIGKIFQEDLAVWCVDCPADGQILYSADGDCNWSPGDVPCRVTKHHWHCSVCGGIVQIG